MNKEEARYLIGLQHDKIIEGELTFTLNEVTYTFRDGARILGRLQLARQVAVIKGIETVTFEDQTAIHTMDITEFDTLCGVMILKGNSVWETKIMKYGLLEADVTEEEIQTIVDSSWE